ncbi:hypothetical protein QR98_0090890 [Sarcoptes scabiei]|uniref:Uncharacterized protein n=1 Tax=Sarcoptes scabiei TaxID=52283 RepID=A0A132AHR1_SARSC|nr:hypothetical protein QR98_0090890 [Sarcoptes scabiei]
MEVIFLMKSVILIQKGVNKEKDSEESRFFLISKNYAYVIIMLCSIPFDVESIGNGIRFCSNRTAQAMLY